METANPKRPAAKKKLVEELPQPPAGIVGRIVEKGFSSSPSPSSFPKPSVLPFPVARHRSHGPHWSPPAAEPENDGDEPDHDPGSPSFAKPIARREKKSLDLSRWREIISGDGAAKPPQKKKEARRTDSASFTATMKHSGSGIQSPDETAVVDTGMQAVLKKRGHDKKPEMEQEGVVAGTGADAPVDDIDVENLARLKQMSAEEIVEAQAEIMERIDPAKLEMLKKRGLGKMGRKSGAVSDRMSGRQESRESRPVEEIKRPKTAASLGDTLLSSESNSSSWKAWSERVEKVRGLRFSLEGNVVESEFTQERSSGNGPEVDQYNIENVAERDLLRTEGDPAAVGYTIKEALSLIRSLVPGQRILAMQILASVFNKVLQNLQKTRKTSPIDKLVDWQAVWAYSLGPEPEMALSLRMALDDNNDSVVLACGKVIQCVLSYDINENFFNLNEKVPGHDKNICTASVFRSRPEVEGDLLHGGYWKYNTKPSNILPYSDEVEDEENEGENTIQDDVVVSGQDFAAGLVRMGILSRICYLLEMDPHPSLEECLVSILTALARHSPTCANALMRCPRLIQNVVKIFIKEGTVEIHLSQIKAVLLLKVLAQSNKQTCLDFVKRGVFQAAMWHWYRKAFTMDQWIKSGKEHCKLTSAMLVEQLRLWKVCIRYGYCITSFADFFPNMCLWLSPPAFENLIENNVLNEFASVARESYLVLEALAQRLPNLHSVEQLNKRIVGFSDNSMEAWSWSHVVPMVDLAIKWLSLKDIPGVSSVIGSQKGITDYTLDPSLSSMLWVVSSVLHMLSSIFDRIPPCNIDGLPNSSSRLPWLPQFVPKVGLEIVRNGFLGFSGLGTSSGDFQDEGGSLLEGLCHLRRQNDSDTSLSTVNFLHGLARLVFSVDSCVQRARNTNSAGSVKESKRETAEGILEGGLLEYAQKDLLRVLSVFMTLVSAEWHAVQSVEMFGRGGPAPGVGFGWGSDEGGFWSLNILLSQMDAQLVVGLLVIFHEVLAKDFALIEGTKPSFEGSSGAVDLTVQRINSVLSVCLIGGPSDRVIVEKAFDILFQPSVLKYLGFCTHLFISSNGFKLFDWQYKEEDYLSFSKILNSHFRDRWLSIKQKSPGKADRDGHNSSMSQNGNALETIHEDLEVSETASKYPDENSLLIEWAHQRLPLPIHWFLSAICCIGNKKDISGELSSDILDVVRSGLFFLLGLEAFSSLPHSGSQDSPISVVPLVWKLHALSVSLHASSEVLKDESTRNVFESLQELYGQHLDKLRCRDSNPSLDNLEILHFQTQVHDNYSTFIENLVQQFAAESYGDTTFGRQIALYLHRSVEAPIRLVTWTVLSNAHVHGSLPSLDKCIAEAEGYLEPAEQNEDILEAYTKSWISGALDRAADRRSISFTMALHHLSSLIFSPSPSKLSLRNKLAKLLLRSYSQKPHQKDMLLELVRYRLPATQELQHSEIERRFELLKQACDGISSLLATVENLRPFV